jgi:small neutral amino acid transporter SnatA (MarC family)
MHEVARTLLYALLAAASPITLLATLIVLSSGRGRANGAAFANAFVLGQAVAFLIAFFVGSAFTEGAHGTAPAYLELAAGLALLAVALRQRPPHGPPKADSPPRTDALFARLERVKPGIAFGLGLPLGVGAKRLAITILAAATVALAGLRPAEQAGLSVLFVLVATLTVSIPVTVYLIVGERADNGIAQTRAWITAHEQQLTFVSVLALGVLFTLDALVRLIF